jgi:hypothetical protein
MTLDELREMLRMQLPPMDDTARIAGLVVAPDVWATLPTQLPRLGKPPVFGWSVTVNRALAPGTIVPVDIHGRPIPKSSMGAPR